MSKVVSCRNYANGFTALVLVLILSTAWGSAKGGRISTGGFIIRSEEEVKWLFEEWQVKHDKSYQDLGEKQKRFEIFKDNLRYIDGYNHPERNHSITVGLNNLADLTHEEYQSIYLSLNLNMSRLFPDFTPDVDLPSKEDQQQASIDWRDMGAVTAVKNQGGCACCWAFTAVATVEGINAIVTGDLVSLSEQEIVDCDDLGTHCQPGWTSRAYDYIQRNMGIDTDANYPYTARQGVCKADKNQVVTIDGYANARRNNEMALRTQVARQPVGSAVDAGGRAFQHYQGGIHRAACTTTVNHAVTIVGYDSEAGEDYWIIKNSYGTGWGEGGYMKLPRNVADRHGKCGIAMWPLYPTKRQNPKSS